MSEKQDYYYVVCSKCGHKFLNKPIIALPDGTLLDPEIYEIDEGTPLDEALAMRGKQDILPCPKCGTIYKDDMVR